MLWLRPTAIQRYEACGEQARLVDVEGWRTEETSSALVFGSCVHKGCLGALVARAEGVAFDPVQTFVDEWERYLASTNIRFNSTHNEKSLRDIGTKLCATFLAFWDTLGLVPVFSDRGVLVEHRLRIRLGPDVGLSGEPDIVAMDCEGAIWIIDLKTPATAAFEDFAMISEQLTAYQLLYDAHAPSMGLPPTSNVMFLEGLKKKSPEWVVQSAPRHSESLIQGYMEKALKTAELMREGYYPKRSAAAFNSPCQLCDLSAKCIKGTSAGFMQVAKRAVSVPKHAPLKNVA